MEVYVARQPIFTKYRSVTGYELLYRSGEKNTFDPKIDGSYATKAVISGVILDFGIETLTGGKKAFINFTEKLLKEPIPELLDPHHFVIEVLEDVPLDHSMLDRLSFLKKQGFTLALDDYCGNPLSPKALECFDIIKLDFRIVPKGKRREVAFPLRFAGKHILAEKVETEQDFQEALNIGCELFQGYFFSRPIILKNKRRDIANMTSIRLTRALSKKDIDLDELTSIIRADAHLTLSLLRKIRTVQYYRGHMIKSVKEALVHIGLYETRRWAVLVLIRDIAGNGSEELIRTALIRAILCEKLIKFSGHPELCEDAFNVGIMSIIDQEDPEFLQLIKDLNLSEQIKKAISGQNTLLGNLLHFVIDYEKGSWEKADKILLKVTPRYYKEAIRYADSILGEE